MNRTMPQIFFVILISMMTTAKAQIADPTSILSATLNDPIPTALLSDNYNTTVPGVMIGWNWGSLPYQANLDVHTNVHHFNSPFFGSIPTNITTWNFLDACEVTSGIVPGVRLIYDPSIPLDPVTYATEFPWYNTLRNGVPANLRQLLDFTHKLPNSLMEGLGIRFQPEIEVQADEYAFTPRSGDNQKAVFGFVVRDMTHGSVPSSTTDVNFHRYVLQQANVTGPTVVLGESWPDGKFGEWPTRREDPQSSPFNGRRMYLAVNLRRVANSDNHDVDDDEPVLRLKIRRLLCSDVAAGTNWADVRFDSIPRTSLVSGITQNWEDLPTILSSTVQGADRGRKLLLQQTAGSGPVTEIVITRQMLPHGDDGRPDITILGHMVFDANPFDGNVLTIDRYNERFLREENTVYSQSCGTSSRIAKLQIQVEYLGNADVAIDWIDLGSDNYTYIMQGYYDRLARDGAEAELLYLDALNDNRPDLTANRAQIMRWYSRDEGSESRWQAMRHYHLLFDENTLTERNVGHNQLRYDYIFNPSFVWEGEQPKIGPRTIAPYIRQGYRRTGVNSNNVSEQRSHLALEWGMTSTETVQDVNGAWHSLNMDYDLRWSHRTDPNNLVGLPAERIATTVNDAYYPRVFNNSVTSYSSGGFQAAYEEQRWRRAQHPEYLFDDRPWIANPWLHSNWSTDPGNNSNIPWLTYHRPLTGEETRLLVWSQLILGSKGFIAFWGTAGDSLVNPSNYDGPNGYALDVGMGPGIPYGNSIRSRVNANLLAGFINDISVTDTMLATDFLYEPVSWNVPGDPNTTPFWQPGMRLGLRNAFGGSYNTVCGNLGLSTTSTPREDIYTGQHSPRIVLSDIANIVNDNQDEIADLHLISWYSRGFHTWTLGDNAGLAAVFDPSDMRTRHPDRESIYSLSTWEPHDSSFVEATLLAIGSDAIADHHVIGVLNRRCNPHDYIATGISPVDVLHIDPEQIFRSTASHFARVDASNDKRVRYRQAGSRMIDIPFRSANPDMVLHVRELGTAENADLGYHPIDTIIGASAGLRVNFLPGEGKLFEVRRLNAVATQQNGHLVHSNQRKMVVYPQADATANTATTTTDPCFVVTEDTASGSERGYFRMINGTTARYHRVWHHSGTPPSVWYQRSAPVDISHESSGAVSKTPVLTWEEPIRLSSQVLVPAQGQQQEQIIENPSSGYPAIVVRYNHELENTALRPEPHYYSSSNGTPPVNSESPYGRQAVAYVVFSAELFVPPIGNNIQIGIVEAMIPADVTRVEQLAALATSPPRVIQNITGSPYAGITGSRHAMWSWGTPMINASSDGNWYCWSSKTTNGIGYGFKRPGQWYFEPGKTGWIVPQIQQNTWFSTHPTLNSYSRLHLGERDAAIAWQEGTDAECGRAIYYSRVRVAQGGNVENYIVNSFTPTPTISPNVTMFGNNRLRLSDGYGNWGVTNDPNGVYPRLSYPSLFRNLSDYELGVDNTRYSLHLVNHKGDRLWWQAELEWDGDSIRTLLIRKWIDVEDNSVHGALADIVTSRPQQFLTAGDGGSLRHPELSQGEQITEMFASGMDIVPNPTGPWWGDSVNCLSFEYTTPDPGNARLSYSLTYGWDLYGAMINHSFGDLTTERAILSNPQPGTIYPHAAARYSMAQMPGFSWNRRIQHNMYSYTPTYQNDVQNPLLSEWSAGFFKSTTDAEPEIITYDGFATDDWSIAVASLRLDGSIPISFQSTAEREEFTNGNIRALERQRATSYASDGFRVDSYRQLDLRAHMLGEWPSGVLTLERQSDGKRFDIQLRDPAITPATADNPLSPDVGDVSLALTNGSNEEYKIVLSSSTDTLVMPTQHLELRTPYQDDIAKRQLGTIRRVIDLTNGSSTSVGSVGLSTYPQPVTDAATIVITMREWQSEQSASLSLKITDVRGKVLYASMVRSQDVVRLDVATWPTGVYAVHVNTRNAQSLAVSTFYVVR